MSKERTLLNEDELLASRPLKAYPRRYSSTGYDVLKNHHHQNRTRPKQSNMLSNGITMVASRLTSAVMAAGIQVEGIVMSQLSPEAKSVRFWFCIAELRTKRDENVSFKMAWPRDPTV